MRAAAALALLAAASWASAADRPVGAVIDDYVARGLQANLSLRSESLALEQRLAELDAARARFFPEVALAARYTRAQGGRQIELPLAQLLNPAYAALNELLVAQGRPAEFGPIPNESFSFIREREQDTRLTLRQPLYVPAVPAALRAQRALYDAAQFERIALARRLKRDVSVGYLVWMQASKATGIVAASRTLLEENLRVNESLFRNGRITQDLVLRARAELLAVDQQLREAGNARDQARSFLNFLLNDPLASELESGEIAAEVAIVARELETLRVAALDARPEISQLDRSVDAAAARVDLARAARRPTLALGIDAGIEGERYEFGSGRNFSTISLLLNWTFFDGGARAAELRGARAQQRQISVQRDELARQVELEVQQTLDALQTSADSQRTAAARAEAARAAFRIASRKRDEGAISQVEFIDARTALTGAELNLNLTRFALLARQAELDYATAAGNLPAGLGN